jgi:hypothetical protein
MVVRSTTLLRRRVIRAPDNQIASDGLDRLGVLRYMCPVN